MNKPSSLRPTAGDPSLDQSGVNPLPAGPDLLLVEGTLFWDKYKLPVLAAIALLAVAFVVSQFYTINREKKIRAASADLNAAKTAADYRHVIDTYADTPAAASATLLLGRMQLDAKDFAGAAQTWSGFADKFPQNSLAPVALTGAGGAFAAMGKTDQARALYQRVATSFPSSYAAPLARLNEASLLKADRKPEEARHIYENLMAANAGSDAARQAAEELRFLRVMPPPPGSVPLPAASPAATGAATPEPATDDADIDEPEAAPAAAPSPAASPSGVQMVSPSPAAP